MKAIIVHEFGGPEALQLEEVADPTPEKGQVLVKIGAAGINPFETYQRAGKMAAGQPCVAYTPGSDGAGEIVAVGEGVEDWRVGDRVYITKSATGTYAELALCDATDVFALPAPMSFDQGAAIGVPYATAHRSLFGKAKAQSGEWVFIHGATGGVGIAAIQLALRAGLKVGGSAGSAAGEEFLESQGLRYTANHNAPNYLSDVLGMTCGRGFDIILEMLANVNLGADPQVLAPFGRVVVIGSRGEVTVTPRDWMSRDATIYGMTLMNATPEEVRQIHLDLAPGFADGTLKPVVGRQFSLAEAPQAHEAVLESGARGKIVLKS